VVDSATVQLAASCAALRNWDRRFDPASRGAVLWRETIASVIAAFPDQNVLNRAGPLWKNDFSTANPAHTPNGAPTNLNPLYQGLGRATQRLASQGLAPNVQLSEVQYTIKNGQRIPVPGANENVGIANAVYNQFPGQAGSSTALEPGIDLGTPLRGTDMTTKGYPVNYGTSFLLTMGFTASGPSARAVLSFSESGNPASPNYADQTRLFSNKQLRDVRYTDAQISGDTKSVEVLIQITIG
jgi:acyl-homoserine-lactone acylase